MSKLVRHLRGWRWSLRWAYTHPSNEGQRLRATIRLIWAKIYTRTTKRDLIVPFGDRSRAIVTQRTPISERCAGVRVTDWPELTAWRSRLQPGDLFVDVGAHIGFYALVMAEHGATTIAVEPHPVARGVLEENIKLNGFEIEVHPVALAAERGVVHMSGADLTQMALGANGIDVKVDTLDTILGERLAAGIKVDVEGFERLVLEGAREALAAGRILAMQLEWDSQSERNLGESRDATQQLLRSFGYDFFRPDEHGHLLPVDPQDLGSDIFAVLSSSQ